jgi:hypothetical protein
VQQQSRDTIIELDQVETTTPEAIRRWPRRRRFLVIVGAAALCWAVPATIVYLLLHR